MFDSQNNQNNYEKKIALNFLPLSTSDFSFSIWRKPYTYDPDVEFNGYINWIGIQSSQDINAAQYEIYFDVHDGCEEFSCNSKTNISLTKKYLLYLLKEKVNTAVDKKNLYISDDRFQDRVFFRIGSHNLGNEVVWLESYFLETTQCFGFLVDYIFKTAPDAPFTKDVQRLSLSLDSSYRSNKNFYIDRYDKIKKYLSTFHSSIRKILPNIYISSDFQKLTPKLLNSKTYLFGDNITDTSQFVGVNKNGPLQKIKGTLHIPIIFENKDAYYIDKFLSALQGKSFATFKGLAEVFRAEVKFYKNPLSDISVDLVQSIITKAHSFREQNNLVVPVVVLESDEDARYYGLKFAFLKEKVPMQVVTRGLISNENFLKWSVSNIGLQIFAKAGGIPWKVKPSNQKSIIFGIGQAHHKVNGQIKKYFSYSVCTDSSGLYQKVNVLGKANDENSYLDQLKENIRTIITDSSVTDMQQVVLHVPFKIKKNELKQIEEAIKQASNNQVNREFVVLKVNQENKFFGYAETNSLVPYESSYLNLSNKQFLIWFEGLQKHKETLLKRIPGPMEVEFYWSNTQLTEDRKVSHLQDLLNLSGTNWRGFNSKNLPISIYYCQLISKYLSQFPNELESFSGFPDPWFL
jgi:hypothetical protein